jgi:CBS-domain-containing membrane protein
VGPRLPVVNREKRLIGMVSLADVTTTANLSSRARESTRGHTENSPLAHIVEKRRFCRHTLKKFRRLGHRRETKAR